MPAADIDKIARAASAAFCGLTLGAFGYQSTLWLGRLRLHVFHREDPGEALHDHPWPFVTFPLTSYVEEVLDEATGAIRLEVVRAFRRTRRPRTHTHRILGRWSGRYRLAMNWGDFNSEPIVKPGAVVTLCWRGRHVAAGAAAGEAWNYVNVKSGRVHRLPWRRYLARADKHPRSSSS